MTRRCPPATVEGRMSREKGLRVELKSAVGSCEFVERGEYTPSVTFNSHRCSSGKGLQHQLVGIEIIVGGP